MYCPEEINFTTYSVHVSALTSPVIDFITLLVGRIGGKMLKLEILLDKLILLVLLTCFSWTVYLAWQKFFEDKIGLSVSNPFSQYRLFPSMSICMTLKMDQKQLLKDIDGNLQKVLDDVLIKFVHKNVTEQEIDKSTLFVHLKRPDHKAVCLAYEPLGPTAKSWDGVTHFNAHH